MDMKTFTATINATPVPRLLISFSLGFYDLSYISQDGERVYLTVSNPDNKGDIKLYRSVDTILKYLDKFRKDMDIRVELSNSDWQKKVSVAMSLTK